jgi:hypothetical protein
VQASELAKMIEGWPEGARPNPPFLFKGTPLDHDGPWWIDNSVGMARGIELTCMSGLRWLFKTDPSATVESGDNGEYVIWSGKTQEGWFEGPTLLHAINAAILASK